MQNQRITSNSMSTNQAHLVNTGTLTHADLNNQIQRAERIAACMPAKLPFPKSRLDQGHLLRTHTGRDQFACGEGSFVLTNIALLPSGGQKKRIDIATPELNTLFVGDMGTPSEGRAAVLSHAATFCDNLPAEQSSIAVGLGDWVYPRGPIDRSPTETARIKTTVLNAFEEFASHTQTFGILGNHEYGCDQYAGDIDYMMEMANKANVEFPGRYYSLEVKGSDWTMDCFALDSSVLISDDKQVQWFKEQVKESVDLEKNSQEKRWRMAFAHHPLQSFGKHHGETTYIADLLGQSLNDIDLYACGHEHNLEYVVQSGTGLPPIVLSGTTSDARNIDGRNIKEGKNSLFAVGHYGYATVKVSKEALNIDFLTFPANVTTDTKPEPKVDFHQTITRDYGHFTKN